ncbi:hypothetical protein BJ165DRAFT_1522310 [Panaeolus papilionaceus]|nr:hypothetical protein BJ165DRAFT_1522310 [Panaeolus papilionaceus]
MSAQPAQASSSRSRNQSRKKANDDAAYFGPPTGGTAVKRQAADKVDGDSRAKRRKYEPSTITNNVNAASRKDVVVEEPNKSMVEFHKMPLPALHRYLIQFEIVPVVYPSPLSPEDPPSPSSLADPQRQISRPPSPPPLTPANRPRRDPKDAQSRRRSSRLLEEEVRSRTPILADIGELRGVLATVVERHFRETVTMNNRDEVDTLAAFMCAVEKHKGSKKQIF